MKFDTDIVTPSLSGDYTRASWYILVAGLSLRVVWALLVSVEPVSDSAAYAIFSENIVNYGVYGWTSESPGAFWPVGTAAIYAFLLYVFGELYLPVVVFNILIGTGIIFIAMRISRRIFGEEVALLTGIVLALWPSLILYVTVLASELPFMFLTLAAIDVWSHPKGSNLRTYLLAGVLLAGACYIRPIALLLPIVFGISFAFYNGQWRDQIIRVVVVMMTMLVLIAPWSVRNYQLFGHVVLISTNGPVTLWMGNHPGTDGAYAETPGWAQSANEYDRSKLMGERAIEYIKADKIGFITRSATKLIRQHSYETIAVTWNSEGITNAFGKSLIFPLKVICQAYWYLVLLLAIGAIFLMLGKHGFVSTVLHPVLAPWIYFSALHAIIVAQDRYHFASIPFIAILSAYMLQEMRNRYHARANR